MNIDNIITHIRANCPSFANRVAGAAEMEAATDQAWLNMPAAYVLPIGASASASQSLNGLYQSVDEAFAVVVALDNRADRRGQAAVTTVDSIRYELCRALLNWRLDPVRAPKGIEYDGERLEGQDKARLIYIYEFKQTITITADDGYQEPSEDWTTTELNVQNRAATVTLDQFFIPTDADTSQYRRLIVPGGVVAYPLTLTRSQTGSSTAFAADGTLVEFGPNMPRPTGPSRRLLVERQRTNFIRNPRMSGAVPGVPGTRPTNFVFVELRALPPEIVATFDEGGIRFVRIRIAGTTPQAGLASIGLETTTGIPASSGQTWTKSAFLRLVSGTIPGLRWGDWRRGAGGSVVSLASGSMIPITSSIQRYQTTTTIPVDPNIQFLQPLLQFLVSANTPYDFVLDVGCSTCELASSVSAPILPPIGSVATSDVSNDSIMTSLSNLNITGPMTLLWAGVVTAQQAHDQSILQITNGSDDNRYRVVVSANTSQISVAHVVAGVPTSTTVGNITMGSLVRIGMTINAAGRIAVSINGAAPVALSGGPSSASMTMMSLTNNIAGTAQLVAEIDAVSVLDEAVTDAELQTRTTSF